MPRNTLVIDKFGLGMACNIGPEDLNENAAYYCYDVNLQNLTGKLCGVYPSADKTSTIGAVGDAQGYAFIQKTDSTWTFLYFDRNSDSLKYITDFYATTPGSITELDADFASPYYSDMIVRHSTIRYSKGTPSSGPNAANWCGYTDNKLWANSVVTTPQKFPQECKTYGDNTGATAGYFQITGCAPYGSPVATGVFPMGKSYFYRYALEYDGYQLSPLHTLYANSYTSCPAAYNAISMNIYALQAVSSPSSFSNNRITAMVIFRAESFTAASPTAPSTSYRFVERIPMESGSWTTSTNDKIYAFIDYRTSGDSTYTYETYSGCSQEATSNIIDWSIACDIDNYMFVGKCKNSSFDEAPYMVFRSVAGRYDMFNWQSATPEFIKMPTIPTAMVGYFGRLLVWDEYNMYRINPVSLAIEEVIPGYGCPGQQSRLVTKYGVFFANLNGVFLYDGAKITKITDNIELWSVAVTVATTAITDSSWRTQTANVTSTLNPLKLGYDSATDMLVVACQGANNVFHMWGYGCATKGWTVLSADYEYTYMFSFIQGKNSELYTAGRTGSTNKFYRMFVTSATRNAFKWVSKRISANKNDGTQTQKVYKIKSVTEGTFSGSIKYGKDSTTINSSLTSSAVAANDRKNNYLHFAVIGSAGDIINTISVIYRTMVGFR